MTKSEPLYVAIDHSGFQAIVWKTDLGLITTVQGSLSPDSNLIIKDVQTSEIIGDVDVRNVLMSILPTINKE